MSATLTGYQRGPVPSFGGRWTMLKHASWNNKRHGHSVAWGRLSQDMQTMKQICGLVSSSRYPNYSGSACWLAQSSRPPTSHLPETQNLSAAENPNMWLATTSSTQNMPTTTRRRVSGRAKGYIGLASLSKLTNKKKVLSLNKRTTTLTWPLNQLSRRELRRTKIADFFLLSFFIAFLQQRSSLLSRAFFLNLSRFLSLTYRHLPSPPPLVPCP